jgi:WD40 repeat protein
VLGGMISVWDRDTKTEATTIDPVGVVRSLAVSRDGKRLAFATTEHVVRVVEITSGTTLGEYRGHSDRVSALLFAPDGESVLSASDDRTVKVWDVPGRAMTVDLPGDDLKSLVVEFSADGATAATAGYDGIIRLCDAATGTERKRLAGHQGAVRALCFFDDDRRLLSCSEDATVRLWDVAAGVELRKWEHPQWVLDVVVVGDAFLSIANDGVVRRAAFAADDLQEVEAPERDRRDTLDHAAFSADGTRLATATKNDFALHDLAANVHHVGFVPSEKNITALKFSPDGRTLAVGDDAGLVTLWRASTQELLRRLRGHSRGVYDLAFSPDGRLIASASGGRWVQASGEVKLWDVASGEVHATVDGGTAPIAFDSQGRRLAVSDDVKRQVRIWTASPYDSGEDAGH